jgi:hypothetical protein
VDRCAWQNYPDGSTGCCLDSEHEAAGVTHCPHILGELTSIPRELIRRSDGRNVACVRVLNTRIGDGATRDPL